MRGAEDGYLNREVLRPVTLSVHVYSVRVEREADYDLGLSFSIARLLGEALRVSVGSNAVALIKPSPGGESGDTVRTPCRLQWVDVWHSACTCECPAVPDRAACSCRAQTRSTVPGLCRRIVCQPPWPSRTLRARPCAVFRRSAGTKCDRARGALSRTSDTCRGRSARR